MRSRAGRGGSREGAGRKPKPKVELRAGKGVASEILAMDGPPDHTRECGCHICAKYPKNCTCVEQCADCGKLENNCECEQYRPSKIWCHVCHVVEDHKICHCEVCGWWEALLSRDMRLRKETRQYLTDRRDGKPAQGVFIGDTRENAPELEFGDLLMPASPDQPGKAGKPN